MKKKAIAKKFISGVNMFADFLYPENAADKTPSRPLKVPRRYTKSVLETLGDDFRVVGQDLYNSSVTIKEKCGQQKQKP